jgi:hypothetical protein
LKSMTIFESNVGTCQRPCPIQHYHSRRCQNGATEIPSSSRRGYHDDRGLLDRNPRIKSCSQPKFSLRPRHVRLLLRDNAPKWPAPTTPGAGDHDAAACRIRQCSPAANTTVHGRWRSSLRGDARRQRRRPPRLPLHYLRVRGGIGRSPAGATSKTPPCRHPSERYRGAALLPRGKHC